MAQENSETENSGGSRVVCTQPIGTLSLPCSRQDECPQALEGTLTQRPICGDIQWFQKGETTGLDP